MNTLYVSYFIIAKLRAKTSSLNINDKLVTDFLRGFYKTEPPLKKISFFFINVIKKPCRLVFRYCIHNEAIFSNKMHTYKMRLE